VFKGIEEDVGCQLSDTVDLTGDGGVVTSVLISNFSGQPRVWLLADDGRLLMWKLVWSEMMAETKDSKGAGSFPDHTTELLGQVIKMVERSGPQSSFESEWSIAGGFS